MNAPLLLGHYDLGWHLAAGNLIRDRRNIPFQDPWSFTLEGRQWYNLSWFRDVIASALFQYTNFSGLILFVVGCGAAIVGYLASLCLSSGASAICSLHCRFLRVSALSHLRHAPKYLSGRFAKHFHNVVLRHFLWGVSEKNEMVFAACYHGPVG
jgi:hypothetical protein